MCKTALQTSNNMLNSHVKLDKITIMSIEQESTQHTELK